MAATFDEVLLNPEYSADAARGGPEWSTAIISCPSGFKQRNINRADFIGRWAIEYDLLTADQLKALYDFFVARRGMAYGFRFVAPEANNVPTASPEQFGTGNGSATTFNLKRVHTSGPRSYERRILKPMAGGLTYVSGSSTIKIYDNGVEQTSGVTVSSTTGVVTFAVAPANAHVLTWSGDYHVPVCFGSDRFESQIDIGSTSLFGIEIVEMLPVELGL
jgi:uncharacterized protein (TIGR02217 family)